MSDDDIRDMMDRAHAEIREERLRIEVDRLEAENARLAAALRSISMGAKRYWREGDDAYQFAILADAALSAVPSDNPADVKTAPQMK
jgi:hypothetical protein